VAAVAGSLDRFTRHEQIARHPLEDSVLASNRRLRACECRDAPIVCGGRPARFGNLVRQQCHRPSGRDSEFRHAAWSRCRCSTRRFVAARIGRRLVGCASVAARPCLHDITACWWHSVLSRFLAGVSPVRHRMVDETCRRIVWSMRPTRPNHATAAPRSGSIRHASWPPSLGSSAHLDGFHFS
jgi:hypothetical protein